MIIISVVVCAHSDSVLQFVMLFLKKGVNLILNSRRNLVLKKLDRLSTFFCQMIEGAAVFFLQTDQIGIFLFRECLLECEIIRVFLVEDKLGDL